MGAGCDSRRQSFSLYTSAAISPRTWERERTPPVARNVPRSVRHELLSFEHHRALARLETTDQRQWIATSLAENDAGRRMSVCRLRRSIEVGRVLTSAELQADPADAGIVNHIPYVNGLVGWWSRMTKAGWLKTASAEKRAALKRDLQPIIDIINEL